VPKIPVLAGGGGAAQAERIVFYCSKRRNFRIFAAVLSIEEILFKHFIISCSYISTIKIAASNIKKHPSKPSRSYPHLSFPQSPSQSKTRLLQRSRNLMNIVIPLISHDIPQLQVSHYHEYCRERSIINCIINCALEGASPEARQDTTKSDEAGTAVGDEEIV
jgi:hypothetical protein